MILAVVTNWIEFITALLNLASTVLSLRTKRSKRTKPPKHRH
jgi:hypothetical protein